MGCLALWCLVVPTRELLANESSYSFRQENLDSNGNSIVHEKTVDPVPMDLIATEVTPNSSYQFQVESLQPDFTSLATRTSIQVAVDGAAAAAEFFQEVEAHASASASLIDEALVEGVSGIPGGSIRFSWLVAGTQQLNLDTTGFQTLGVSKMQVSAKLESTLPDLPFLLLDDVRSFPDAISNNQNFEQLDEVSTEALEFQVPWIGGELVPIAFDLTTSADFAVSNLDASGFEAMLTSDFYNTAVLSSVEVLDQNQNPLPEASFFSPSTGFYYVRGVPEPSSLTLAGAGLCLMLARRRARHGWVISSPRHLDPLWIQDNLVSCRA